MYIRHAIIKLPQGSFFHEISIEFNENSICLFKFSIDFFLEIYEISLVGESRMFVISRLNPGKLNLKLNLLANHAE